jgi:pSer/pThr/pTyr-binding forkhead associated (FHA) protein
VIVQQAILGTAEDCDIRVHDDPYVSSQHARITRDADGHFWLQDLGSTNGTWIVGRLGRVRVYGPTLLQPGDQIWLGGRTSLPWTGEA